MNRSEFFTRSRCEQPPAWRDDMARRSERRRDGRRSFFDRMTIAELKFALRTRDPKVVADLF
jgi:hypothetical protein